MGMYNIEGNQTSCTACPDGKTTADNATDSVDKCGRKQFLFLSN